MTIPELMIQPQRTVAWSKKAKRKKTQTFQFFCKQMELPPVLNIGIYSTSLFSEIIPPQKCTFLKY